MKVLSTLAVVAGLSAAVPAFADPVTYSFEDQTQGASISIPSNPYGIAASASLLAVVNGDGFGNGINGEYFSNNPGGSVAIYAAPQAAGQPAPQITSTAGFTQSVSFLYSSNAAGHVDVLNATGGVLGTFNFGANSTSVDHPYNTWTLATLTFAGLGHAIDFTGSLVGGNSIAAFDNVSLNPVPLPAGLLLLPSGLAALGLVRRRRNAAA